MGILVMYDVGEEKSFLNVRRWLRQIEAQASPTVVKVLVGNKCDLTTETRVTTARGRALAEEFGMQFFEASARTGENVCESFEELTRQVKTRVEPVGDSGRVRLDEKAQARGGCCSKG
jgi:GTPase SAR1 family protein